MDPILKYLNSASKESSKTRTLIQDKESDSHFQTKCWLKSFPQSEQSAVEVQQYNNVPTWKHKVFILNGNDFR